MAAAVPTDGDGGFDRDQQRGSDDFCRTCSGSGRLYDQDYRPGIGLVSIAMDCWACNGTGFGK